VNIKPHYNLRNTFLRILVTLIDNNFSLIVQSSFPFSAVSQGLSFSSDANKYVGCPVTVQHSAKNETRWDEEAGTKCEDWRKLW